MTPSPPRCWLHSTDRMIQLREISVVSQELFYTSAPKGLQPGSRGFCTVAMTRGLSAALVEKLESLSGYRALFPPHDAQAGLNPIAHCHLRVSVGGKTQSVLPRIGPAGLGYPQRTQQ